MCPYDSIKINVLRAGELTLRYIAAMLELPPIPCVREHLFWYALCGFGTEQPSPLDSWRSYRANKNRKGIPVLPVDESMLNLRLEKDAIPPLTDLIKRFRMAKGWRYEVRAKMTNTKKLTWILEDFLLWTVPLSAGGNFESLTTRKMETQGVEKDTLWKGDKVTQDGSLETITLIGQEGMLGKRLREEEKNCEDNLEKRARHDEGVKKITALSYTDTDINALHCGQGVMANTCRDIKMNAREESTGGGLSKNSITENDERLDGDPEEEDADEGDSENDDSIENIVQQSGSDNKVSNKKKDALDHDGVSGQTREKRQKRKSQDDASEDSEWKPYKRSGRGYPVAEIETERKAADYKEGHLASHGAACEQETNDGGPSDRESIANDLDHSHTATKPEDPEEEEAEDDGEKTDGEVLLDGSQGSESNSDSEQQEDEKSESSDDPDCIDGDSDSESSNRGNKSIPDGSHHTDSVREEPEQGADEESESTNDGDSDKDSGNSGSKSIPDGLDHTDSVREEPEQVADEESESNNSDSDDHDSIDGDSDSDSGNSGNKSIPDGIDYTDSVREEPEQRAEEESESNYSDELEQPKDKELDSANKYPVESDFMDDALDVKVRDKVMQAEIKCAADGMQGDQEMDGSSVNVNTTKDCCHFPTEQRFSTEILERAEKLEGICRDSSYSQIDLYTEVERAGQEVRQWMVLKDIDPGNREHFASIDPSAVEVIVFKTMFCRDMARSRVMGSAFASATSSCCYDIASASVAAVGEITIAFLCRTTGQIQPSGKRIVHWYALCGFGKNCYPSPLHNLSKLTSAKKKNPLRIDKERICLEVDKDGIPAFATIVERFTIASMWRNHRGNKADWRIEDFLVWTVTPQDRDTYLKTGG
jgi:hypothetical protein